MGYETKNYERASLERCIQPLVVKLLISGDSYSESTLPWTKQFNAQTVGYRGWSNREIYHSLNNTYSVAIISLTSLHRLPFKIQTLGYDEINKSRNVTLSSNKKVFELNYYWAHRIIDEWAERSVIWSTFPDYDSWKSVLSINLKQEDEMWDNIYKQTEPFDGHLTLLGHKQLQQLLVDELKKKKLWDQAYLRRANEQTTER